jgi:hypothetical protein
MGRDSTWEGDFISFRRCTGLTRSGRLTPSAEDNEAPDNERAQVEHEDEVMEVWV